MQDEKIVELYWQRNETAIDETKRKYEKYLHKIAFNILSDIEDSRESVNDTYLAAWDSMPPHRPSILSTYLAKLTRRIAIDSFRRKNRDKRRASSYAVSLDELGEVADGAQENDLDAKMLAKSLNDFLLTLSDKQRNLFVLRYFFLDSLKAAADCCGMSESAAKSTLHRTRCALKVHLEREGYNI